MTCSVRLWDAAARLLATEHECAEPKSTMPELSIAIVGDGPISKVAKAMIERNADSSAWYITVDYDHLSKDRVAAVVTRISVDEHTCECGQSKIVTTSIGGARELFRSPNTKTDGPVINVSREVFDDEHNNPANRAARQHINQAMQAAIRQ